MMTTMTSKGQITLPKAIRDKLGLDTGSRLDFSLQDDGTIRVRAMTHDPLAISRVLPPPSRAKVGDAEIHAAIRARAAARFKRSVK